VPDSGEPPAQTEGGAGSSGIPRSEHARLRFGQGRPIAEVVNDVQKAGPREVYVQVDDGRFVVRGPKGREHVIDPNGEHVTSLRRPDAAHQARARAGAIRPASDEEFQSLKAFVQ
jgi:hypothetical protein